MKNQSKLTPGERSWILYDVANSAFVLVIITTVMPIFFKDVASQGVSSAVSTANWGFANSAASLILAILAPILGTLADYRNFKKRFWAFFIGLGVFFTLSLTAVSPGRWLLCLLLFILARVGFAGANIFYDSFITDITTKDRMDWVSALGYGWGYIGSVIPFLAVIGLLVRGQSGGGGMALGPMRLGFVIVAVWWAVFSIPMMKNVHQVHFIPKAGHLIGESFRRLARTFTDIRKYRQAFLFLLAYFFYIDGVDTIITMATAYGRDIGLGVNMLLAAILMIQIVAFPMALLFGKLSQRFGAKNMIHAGIWVYGLITLLAFVLPFLSSLKAKTLLFWGLAFLVASSQGGIQALSRSYFGRLIPPERSAEFFGFYNIFGKFAAITGPFLMAVISRFTGDSRYGILSILLLFILGGFLLKKVRPEEGF
ncbi:MAG: MFS transporter [Proteobacteria bacterium]|nr:MFS transporter [Pseudomonadota bacterium]MBU4471606.1 MFS transporter [Pseudomonadota bacterium]MCG2751088.1 MFS transporter [Desulfobacteraceae bacterium]